MTSWINLFSRSPKARLLWKDLTGVSILSHSVTRWWSKFEMIKQLSNFFGDVFPFLKNSELPATARKLLEIIEDSPSLRKLKIEIAITVDTMEPFVKATYNLEGDGPLVFYAYHEICVLYSHISLGYYPNTQGVARDLAQENATRETQLLQYSKKCYPPAYKYLKTNLTMI